MPTPLLNSRYPPPNSRPSAITTGPDGALWFSEFTSNRIGRIPTSATVDNLQLTEFPVPGPLGITSGPDGALWFIDAAESKIARITTTGAVTEFSIPTAKSREITTGPGGALWFTYARGKIRRITTSGTVTEFAIPPQNSSPGGITTGPDGALWFTEASCIRQSGRRCTVGNKIGRITTSGLVTEFPIPSEGSGPHSITTGPDGSLWFTEYYGSRIGRLVLR